MLRWTIPIILSLLWGDTFAQSGFTLSGTIKDKATGEDLIGAHVQIAGTTTGVPTNVYGYYALTLPPGTYNVRYSFMGYTAEEHEVRMDRDITMDIVLAETLHELKTVEVYGRSKDANVTDVQMSSTRMGIETIKSIPPFMGEVDVIKALQMLPGVQTMGEGGSGMYVRGGAVDQNLVMLDEAPVYNAAHLLGFFSVFNGDAIKDVQLYKGGIPALYGGRLSSVVDIRMKDGNNQRFSMEGGVGTIASRLTVQAPIKKNKGSFIVSGRRTYADQFLRFSDDKGVKDSKLYFYDLNLKANYTLGAKDRVFLSGYFGRDVFKNKGFGLDWGNATGTARWNHVFNARLFANFTGFYSTFNYGLGSEGQADAFKWESSIRDVSGKVDFNYYLNPKNTIKVGGQVTLHAFAPANVTGQGDQSAVTGLDLPLTRAREEGIYVSNEQRFGGRFSATYGVRLSAFENLGSDQANGVDPERPKETSHYVNWEPRVGMRFALTETTSIKASYNRTAQYLHLASNGNTATPFDIWFPTSARVKPELADQVALGWFRNLANNRFEVSVEGYYKVMRNAVDFRDNADLFLNAHLENDVFAGTAWAYGSEFMLRKQEGRLTGMLSYTLSRSERRIEGINNGELYRNKYDKTHNVSLTGSYKLNDQWSFGATWVYQTGSPATMPVGRFEFGGQVVPIYSDRNAARLPDYHRLDFSVTKASRKNETRRWQGEWVLGVHNAYARKNAYSINFRQDQDDPNKTFAEKTYLFSIVPSVTYNFKF